jgi:hypothetical protein
MIHAELIKASHYYGRCTPGWVAVICGSPWHFTGRTGKKDAQAAVNKAIQEVAA